MTTTAKPHPTLQGLYAITPDFGGDSGTLYRQVQAALEGGVRWLQYRDKSPDHQRRSHEAAALLALCRRHRARLIINDDLDLARQVGADGVHLGQQDTGVGAARQQLGPQALIGATCHDSLELAEQAVAEGASYCAFGRLFPSQTKPQARPAPLHLLTCARDRLGVSVVAIGGLNLHNAPAAIRAGADAVAVSGALFGATDIRAEAHLLSGLFDPAQHLEKSE